MSRSRELRKRCGASNATLPALYKEIFLAIITYGAEA